MLTPLSGEFNFGGLNFDGIVNELPDDLDVQGISNDGGGQAPHNNQDPGMGASLSQLLSRSTPTSQTSMPMAVNSVSGVQTSRSPGMVSMMNMNMGMGKNHMSNSLATTLSNSNKVATSSHIGMNDGLVSSTSFTMSGANTGMIGGVTLKPTMGNQQIMANITGVNMGQQMPNQMMNGPTNFQGNAALMRSLQNNVTASTSMSMPQAGMMPNPGMSQMQGHQGMQGHPNMNMPQNPGQMNRVSILFQ